MQLVEILENVLEHLPAPKQLHHHQHHTSYTPQVLQTLSACLSVSKQVRHLAAERLFHTLHVKSSNGPHHVDILLKIINPQLPSQEWMSIRPFIRKFIFTIDSSSLPIYLIPLFTTLADAASRITHFEIRISIPIFNHSFENAVLRFIKLPTLQSLAIHGRFFTRDFLLGTRIHELAISGHGIDLNFPESNDFYTEEQTSGAEISYLASRDDDQPSYPSLQRFKTDLVWPRGFPGRAVDSIFRDLSHLSVEINISHTFIKAEALIKQSFSALTTLIITYNFDGYEPELPTAWSINFGEFQSLQTLEFNWKNSTSSIHQSTILKGCRPLAGLHSLLDTIQTPMRSLTTIRWNFSYLLTSLPPHVLSNWFKPSSDSDSAIGWRKLDESLAFSGLFPSLRLVSLGFCPVVLPVFTAVNHPNAQLESDARLVSISDDLEVVESILSENRQTVFPGLTASLGENFLLNATGGSAVADERST